MVLGKVFARVSASGPHYVLPGPIRQSERRPGDVW